MDQDLDLISNLLSRMEDNTLDFKRDQYRLDSDHQKTGFVEDIICMANTPREESAYILIGVLEDNGRASEVVGTLERPDPVTFQNLVNGRTDKAVRFSFREVGYLGKTVGLFEIPVEKESVPILTRRTFGKLKSGVIYARRNAQNCEADSNEIRRIINWAEGENRHATGHPINDFSAEPFLRACDYFEPGRLFVGVLGSQDTLEPDDSQAFAKVGWQLLVDFDQATDERGMASKLEPILSTLKSFRLTALDQPIGPVSTTSSILVAAKGLTSRPSTIRSNTWREWNQLMVGPLSETIRRLAEVTEPNPATAVIFGREAGYTDTVCNLLDQAFKSRLSFVFANERPDIFEGLALSFEGTSVAISLPAICSAIRSQIPEGDVTESVDLPRLEGGIATVPPDRARWLEEELELVHKNVGLASPEPDSELEGFLKGSQISWQALNLGVDVTRTVTAQLQRRVSQELETRTTRRLNVWHWPGGGGTTVARRVAWHLHNEFPAVIAKRVVPESLTERLTYLFELTRLPVLALIEDSVANHNNLDGMYDRLRSGNIPVVLLTTGRRDRTSNQPGSLWVDGMLDNAEASAFAAKLAAQVPNQRAQLDQLKSDRRRQRRTPFYFGLVAFGKDFVGLEPYVSHRLLEASEPLLNVVRMSSLLYHYGQKSTPIQILSSIFSLPKAKSIPISSMVPSLLQELFIQESDRSIRPAHELVAEEMLQQVLSRGVGDKRNWKSGLAECAIDVIEVCAEHHGQAGGATADLVRSVLIERGTQETPSGLLEGQFSNLVEEIPSPDGQRRVLEKLTELFPDEAHFWAHRGRFYTRRLGEHPAAHEFHAKALQLAPNDPVLSHMAGMAFRGELDEVLEQVDATTIQEEEERVQSLAEEALNQFETSQKLDPRREHSYISAIELIAKVVRVTGRVKGFDQSTASFLVAPGESWYRELVDKAETLMDDLILIRAGEEPGGYLQRARASLDQAYGNLSRAIEGWTNLLDRSDIFHPPLRRNIINAYLTRRNRQWSQLTDNELHRVADLAQQNLQQQPDSDQNLRIWFRAVRELANLPLGQIAERLTYKSLRNPTIDTLYYLYIIKFLQANDGGSQVANEAIRTIEDCARQAANLPHRTRSFEWFGKGNGIQALVHEKDLGAWDPSSEFWSNVSSLKSVNGRISAIHGPAAGEIELSNGLKAFFVPARGRIEGGYLRGRDEDRRVNFFLGFSYDGLRAWSVGEADPI